MDCVNNIKRKYPDVVILKVDGDEIEIALFQYCQFGTVRVIRVRCHGGD